MSSSPAQLQLSPARSPSLSTSAFSRSPPRDTPATPSTCLPHAPPTPPDSSSRITQNFASSPRSNASPDTSSDLSLAAAFSSAPQFQSRLLDTPIDIHCLSPELDSPAVPHESAVSVDRDAPVTFTFKPREQGSPTPTQEVVTRKVPDTLPPPFVPASARLQGEHEELKCDSMHPPPPDSRPPNVYINGLPPNFPEEDLLAMTRQFGAVLSVRTFTRHVSDKPSGYGFVLFERYSAAEKCIETLRKYRNLHPSFSKQVHKIPGTAYSSVPPAISSAAPEDSFKAKMEQLGDTASTNLYMEGLPLSTTDEALRALVTPYRIMSSRFFHTRLSDPIRLIAFVRLESRTAAEDIVERLHGRLVRGWNDTGCRISVRFADTAEQRELRRSERQNREGEQSPARLTMARAALLNLKGTQCQTIAQPSLMTEVNLSGATSPNLGLALNQLSLGQLGGQISPLGGTPPLPTQDAFVRGSVGRQDLTSFGVGVPGLDPLNARAALATSQNLRLPQHIPGASPDLLDDQTELQLALLGLQGLRARAQNGYTPVEQLILQAHARQQRASDTEGVHGQNSRGMAVGPRLSGANSNGRDVSRRLLDFLPQMSEDDFHASGGLTPNQQSAAQNLPLGLQTDAFSRAIDPQAAIELARQISLSGHQARQRNHTLATQARSDLSAQASHIRSTTLPSQYLSVHNGSHSNNLNAPLYDSNVSLGSNGSHNSLRSSSTGHSNNLHATNSKHNHYAASSNSTTSRNASTNNLNSSVLPDTQTLFTSKNNINVPSTASRIGATTAATGSSTPSSTSTVIANRLSSASSAVNRSADPCATNGSQDADDEDEQSPVVSPALTYSARTPASLSPATPYSGFFEGGETFKSAGIGISQMTGAMGDVCLDSGHPNGKHKPAEPVSQ